MVYCLGAVKIAITVCFLRVRYLLQSCRKGEAGPRLRYELTANQKAPPLPALRYKYAYNQKYCIMQPVASLANSCGVS
jgi:hypothetical protein